MLRGIRGDNGNGVRGDNGNGGYGEIIIQGGGREGKGR